jgi:O-antigen/teichoic acid export membrane protein
LATDFHWRSLLSSRSAWAFSGQALNILFGLMIIRSLTELVAPGEFGRSNLILGAIALVNGIVCGPLMQATLRLLPEYSVKNTARPFLKYLKGLLVKTTLLVCLVFFVSAFLFSYVSFSEIILIAALYVLDTVRSLWLTILSANDDQKSYAILSSIDAFLRPLGALLASAAIGGVMFSVLVGMLVGGGLTLCIVFFLRKKQSVNVESAFLNDSSVSKELICFCLPLIPLNFIGWITSSSDRYIAAELLGTSAAGLYIAIYGLTSKPCIACSGAIELVMRPNLYKEVAENRIASADKVVLVWLVINSLVGIASILAFYFLQDVVASLLLAEAYRSSAFLMPWIAAGFCFFSIGTLFEIRIRAFKKTQLLLVVHGLTAVASVLFVYTLGKRFGMLGIAMAAPCYYGVFAVLSAVFSQFAKKLIEPKDVSDKSFIPA